MSIKQTPWAKIVSSSLLAVLVVLGGTPASVSALGDSTPTFKSRSAVTTTTGGTLTEAGISVAKYDTVLIYFWSGSTVGSQPAAPTDSNGCVYTVAQTVGSLSTNYYGVAYICASEPADNASMYVSLSPSSSSPQHTAMQLRVYSGVNNTTPIDVKSSGTATGSSSTIPTQTLTTTIDNERLVFAGMQYSNYNGTYTVGSGFSNDGTGGANFSSSYKTYCDADKSVPTATTVSSSTGCTVSGTSAFGYSSITLALQPGACTTGQTGTYPNCVTPPPPPPPSTVTHVVCDNCTDVDIHYLHQLAIKGAAIVLATFTAIVLIYPFRYRGHNA